jgi:hypothetical protein
MSGNKPLSHGWDTSRLIDLCAFSKHEPQQNVKVYTPEALS